MKIQHLKSTVAITLAGVTLLACAPTPSGNSVSSNQAQTASTVIMGTITGSRAVTVEANPGGAGAVVGTILGGVAGAALGNEVGGGIGKTVATGVGATAGAAAGNRVAAEAGRQQSIEWFVRTDGGQTISVVQASPTFANGQRVQIVQSGSSTRLVPAT